MKRKLILAFTILLLAVGFAATSTTLTINGSTNISENIDDLSVIFTAASLDGTDVYASVIDETKEIISFSTSGLTTLNQTSVLTYEITNNSSNYDANISVDCKAKDNTTAKYTSIKNELEENTTKVLAKDSVNGTLTATLNQSVTGEVRDEYVCTLTINALERDTLGKEIQPESFATDSWKTIQRAVKTGNTSKYNVGDTRKIELESFGTHTIRIANKSECESETSETACGFVVEFADVITKNSFNSTGTNVGGWRDSKLRTYINDTIYKSLPSDLQNVITTTKVISGHGSTSGETNFETQDKLYLLSAHEVYEDGTSNQVSKYDTSYNNTKQLDYYKNQGVTTSSYAGAIKKYNRANSDWWLRSARSGTTNYFLYVRGNNGGWSSAAYGSLGVSPAFRLQGPTAFQKDDWETIASNVKAGNTSKYNVGDTKEVDLGDLGTHTVRVANKSECTNGETSETACGFVVEFADIIENRPMNTTNTNVGGWKDSEIRTYINDTIYKSLPSELQNVITSTKVISSHGSTSGETNFETQDKLYLLSAHEVWEDGTSNPVSTKDTTYNTTKQLDYYKNQGVTTSNKAGAIKQYNGANSDWWLRSAYSRSTNNFFIVSSSGSWLNCYASYSIGVSPAFRLQGPTAFQKDSWSTIAANVKAGNTSKYNVGDTKEVDLGDLGTHTVRVANKSECTNGETSETACGFVVEFADVITHHSFNSTGTNVGGWRDSKLRTYINNTIYKSLPSDLQNVITTTKVISGHGRTSGETNFETQDKLYLLSAHEVWKDGTSNQVSEYDTSYNNTKQLDYYKNQGVTTSSYAVAIKQYNGSNSYWWLRSARSSNASLFLYVGTVGRWTSNNADNSCGVSPAFRIA